MFFRRTLSRQKYLKLINSLFIKRINISLIRFTFLLSGITNNPLLYFLKPFGFLDYVNLQMNALCTISDSGTISEESSILNFPAISLCQSMEHLEAQYEGVIILTGFDPQTASDCIHCSINEFTLKSHYTSIASDYTIDNSSWRVLKFILGNTNLSNLWYGIKK